MRRNVRGQEVVRSSCFAMSRGISVVDPMTTTKIQRIEQVFASPNAAHLCDDLLVTVPARSTSLSCR